MSITKIILDNKSVRHLLAQIYITLRTIYETDRKEGYRSKYNLDPDCELGDECQLYGDGEIIMGPQSYIGWHSTIQSSKGYKVQIGRNVAISHFCRIYTESRIADQDFSKGKLLIKGNVLIENDCWIGANVTIIQGITIGNGVVVGANSLVNRDLPDGVIAGGNPVRILKLKTSF